MVNPQGRTLTFITTDQCGARCAHCLMESGPERESTLTYESMRRRMDDIASGGDVQLVVFTGGECTRLGDDLLESIAYASANGLLTRVVTNVEWAVDEVSAASMIRDLREAGLREINFSYDDFHRVWVPEANLLNAWRAAKGVGFGSVVVALASGPRSRVTVEWLRRFLGHDLPLAYDETLRRLPLPEPSADGTRYLISNSRLIRVGRGRGLRQGYMTPEPVLGGALFQRCPPENAEPVITSEGNVAACCGIYPNGNEVLDLGPDGRPSAAQRTILAAIRQLGPGYLLGLLNQAGVQVRHRNSYVSICEVCEDVTRNPTAVAYLAENLPRIEQELLAASALASAAPETES